MKDKFFYSTENIKTYYIYKWDGVFSGKQGEQCRFDRGPLRREELDTFASDLIEENFYEMPKIEEKDIKNYGSSYLKYNKRIEEWLGERYVIIEYDYGEMKDVYNWLFHTMLVKHYLAKQARKRKRISNKQDTQAPVVER